MGLEAAPIEQGTATFGEVIEEDDTFVVPTTTEDEDGAEELEFVVREDDGELRIDMNLTMARAMGVSPDEFLEQMAEGMGGVMEGVVDAMGEALSGAFGGEPDEGEVEEPGERAGPVVAEDFDEFTLDEEPPAEPTVLPGKTWVLAEDAFPPQDIVDVAYGLSEHFRPDFRPPVAEIDTVESADDEGRYRTSRFGDGDQGFELVQAQRESEEYIAQSLDVSAFGMPAGRELALSWSRTALPDQEPIVSISVVARGPADLLESLEAAIAGNCEIRGTYDV
jgi:hypothetical protein